MSNTHTVCLHRVLRAPPDRVYKAFIDRNALAKWNAPFGFTCTVHELDAQVGGGFRMAFNNFATGQSHEFSGSYIELVPGRRLVYTDRFDDSKLPGEISMTIDFTPVSCGTDLQIVQAGVPAVIPLEMCYLGWQDSLLQLAQLVETEVPG